MKHSFFYIIFILFAACNTSQESKQDKLPADTVLTKDTIVKTDSSDYFSDTALYDDDVYFDTDDYEETEPYLDTANCKLNLTAGKNYKKTKEKIVQIRLQLQKEYEQINDSLQKRQFLDSVSEIFCNYLLNEIIPYWYGTQWTFNGYTSVPNQGTVACGYFVSTTLEHMDVNINRYKFAQQSAENEAKTLCFGNKKNMRVFKNQDFYTDTVLNTIPDGLYMSGLDYHVGYLYKKQGKSFFINSDYVFGYVLIADAEKADAFASQKYYLTKLSSNYEFLDSWLLNKEIKIVKK